MAIPIRLRLLLPALGGLTVPHSLSAQEAAQDSASQTASEIIVMGARQIIAALEDDQVEQVYDADRVASYARSTIGALIDDIAEEQNDHNPAILVNGVPVADLADIEDFPPEVVRRLEVLPRGSAAKIGGEPGQRSYNIVLKQSDMSVIATASTTAATEGDWLADREELALTYISGRNRLNLTLRRYANPDLSEGERGLTRQGQSIAYAFAENLPTVDLADESRQADYRSLRPESETTQLRLAGTLRITDWLMADVNVRADDFTTHGSSGLNYGLAVLPASHPRSPYDQDVALALEDPETSLGYRSRNQDIAGGANLAVTKRAWRLAIGGRVDRKESSASHRQPDYVLQSVPPIIVNTVDPFSDGVLNLLHFDERTTRSTSKQRQFSANLQGPLFQGPSGKVLFRASAVDIHGTVIDRANLAEQRKNDFTSAKAGFLAPIFADLRRDEPILGDLSLSLDAGIARLSERQTVHSLTSGLNWQLRHWVQVSASFTKEGEQIDPILLDPSLSITPQVTVYDPREARTVLVTQTSGGNPNLLSQQQELQTVSLNLAPYPKYNLQLGVTYSDARVVNPIGYLPPASSAIIEAFPERFTRNGEGVLLAVDSRPVNFASKSTKDLRSALSFSVPLGKVTSTGSSGLGGVSRLQVSASHSLAIEDSYRLRDELAPIDLLEGGAVGFGGGRPRHQAQLEVTFSRKSSGVSVKQDWRSVSSLQTGRAPGTQRLTFGAIGTMDLKAFAQIDQLFAAKSFLRGTRVSVTIDNLANARQSVTDASGVTPLAYEPARRDPIGRSISIELRKVF